MTEIAAKVVDTRNTPWKGCGTFRKKSLRYPTICPDAGIAREGFNDLTQAKRTQIVLSLREAAKEYSTAYKARHTPKSAKYSQGCINHLVEHLSEKMLIEITDKTVQGYQLARLNEGATGKIINEEVGELFRVMAEVGDAIRLKLRKAKRLKLKQRDDCGRALTTEEEQRIREQARKAEIACDLSAYSYRPQYGNA